MSDGNNTKKEIDVRAFLDAAAEAGGYDDVKVGKDITIPGLNKNQWNQDFEPSDSSYPNLTPENK